MTIEEKANAYDKAIGKAAALYKASEPMSGCNVILETLFPELKESEDEKVRKLITLCLEECVHSDVIRDYEKDECIAWLEKQGEACNSIIWHNTLEVPNEQEELLCEWESDDDTWHDVAFYHANTKTFWNGENQIEDVVKWIGINELLEKQGEQKPTDKVEPKFKVGDWLINPRTSHIIHIKDVLICGNKGIYELENSSMSIENIEDNFRLWTIQDAKDGDMLYINNTVSESIIIYKSFNNGLIKKYASYNKFGFEGEHYLTLNDGYIVPATKEQRDLLFQKMKEAGWEWDAEKRELKKINSYCQENCKGFQETGRCFVDGECKAKREAERELTNLEEFINELSKQFPDVSFAKLSRIVVRVTKWAKSNQPKQEWNEEDNYYRNHIIQIIEEIKNAPLKRREDWEAYINWLKSIKGRIQPKTVLLIL